MMAFLKSLGMVILIFLFFACAAVFAVTANEFFGEHHMTIWTWSGIILAPTYAILFLSWLGTEIMK
jgi:hypothetical protein